MTKDGEPLLRLSPQEREELEEALRQTGLSARFRERLEMVKAADMDFDSEQIAAWSRRTPRTVRRWLAAFKADGIEALCDAPRSGRPPRADAFYRKGLEEAIETRPRELGLPFDVWTSERLSAYLEEQTGTRIAPGWLRALLGRGHFACGRPKHKLEHLQDPEEVAACEKELAQAGGKSPGSTRTL